MVVKGQTKRAWMLKDKQLQDFKLINWVFHPRKTPQFVDYFDNRDGSVSSMTELCGFTF